MQQAELVLDGPVALENIHVEGRLRPVSEAALESLMVSIAELGIIKDAVHLRKVGGKKARLILIAGAHRVEAARRLGWDTIPAKVWTCSADWARIMECDDNLASAEMDALELAVFLSERKRVYEKLHPETRRGGNRGNQHIGGRQTDTMSFCQTIAEKRGLSERHVRRLISIGERLDKDDVPTLFRLERRPTMKDLLVLSDVPDPDTRSQVLGRFIRGDAKKMKDAIADVQGTPPPLPHHKKIELGLEDYFQRASIAQRRSFVRRHKAQLEGYLATIAKEAENG